MSTITEKTKNGKVVAFKFLAHIGRDEKGKQHFRTTTWKPPAGMSYAKARKMAEAEAYKWEQELLRGEDDLPQGEYTTPIQTPCEPVPAADVVQEEETFRYFVEKVWMPFKVVGGGLRPSTISMYNFMLKVILPHLGDKRIKEITPIDIMQYLQFLRDEYHAPDGRTLSEKSVKHHFDVLRIIFNYAERQEVIEKNPIKKADAPRTIKRPVDALTQEQAKIFFNALSNCTLEYRCMMLLMATTGIRRGECLGLQWQDFNFYENPLHIARNTTYTKMSGTVVAELKTPCSVRTIPLMDGVKVDLLALKQEQTRKRPHQIEFVESRRNKYIMDKAVELIVSWIQKNLRNPKFYAVLAVLVIIVVLIFPYIDANFLFFNRIEKRVGILQSLSEIDMEKVSQSLALQKEYDSILAEIEKQRIWSISGVIASEQSPTASNISLFKFLFGGSLAWIIALCVPFMNTFKDKKTQVFGFLLLILLGGFLGGIGYMIPTISNPWINYIGFPILQLIALIALTVKPNNG